MDYPLLMGRALSKYYRLPVFDGLEALDAVDYNGSFPAHFHSTYNISLVYGGAFHTKIGTNIISPVSGSILITNPGEIHANPSQQSEARTFFTFYLSPDFFEQDAGKNGVWFHDKVVDDERFFNSLTTLALRIRLGNTDDAFETGFREVFNQLATAYASSCPAPGSETLNLLLEEYLLEAGDQKFSLQSAADRFGIDKYKFLRLFKLQTGLSPNNYLIFQRIEKSKILLREDDDLLGIAIELGFCDSAHFCKHFRKFTGTSPIAFRNSLLQYRTTERG